jgi:hypothetical protein
MGAYLFFIVCTGIWIAFGWSLTIRPEALDRAWTDVRALRWSQAGGVDRSSRGSAVSPSAESRWGSPRVRRVLVGLVAVAFSVFWASVTFPTPGRES